jgi:type II secretory pathway component PulC
MVRGLVIRQLFLVVNLALVGLILFAAVAVVLQMINPPKAVNAVTVDPGPAGDGDASIAAELRERLAYNSIVENGLFGDAGRFKEPEVEETPVVQAEPEGPEEETDLSLKLWAVTSLSPKSPFASASIEDTSQRNGSQLFHIGNSVVENVTLEEVHPRWVVLINRRDPGAPKRERLSMDEEEEGGNGAAAMANAAQGRGRTTLPSQEVEIDRNDFINELTVNYADLLTKVKPELYRDENGKVAGITAADIAEVPLAQQLGLENGDVLQTVNNEQIDSQEKILEMVQKYQDAGSFRIGIMRNGKQKIITYNFR